MIRDNNPIIVVVEVWHSHFRHFWLIYTYKVALVLSGAYIPNHVRFRHQIMAFPLSDLPLELALEILRLAASPQVHQCQSRHQTYETARALALVSHNIRQVVMPHLLHTVILNTQESVNLFNQSLRQQKRLIHLHSRLSLNYPSLVCRIWSSRFLDPIVQQPENHFQNYSLLCEVFSRAETVGFNSQSLHLLYETLGGAYGHSPSQWKCKRLTFAGHYPRWNPLTSTTNGLAFLRQLSHLTICVPSHDTLGPPSDTQIPNWIQRIPFEFMPNLTHFAFSLVTAPGAPTMPILAYTLPSALRHQEKSIIFKVWAASLDPLTHGKLFNLNVDIPVSGVVPDLGYEMAYLRYEDDIWSVSRQLEL